MFVVIYSFQVRPGKEHSFVQAWKALTELIYKYQGSLGSRLHKSNGFTYIGYAQWPNKETWKRSDNLPQTANELRKQLREYCDKIAVKYELELVQDLLQSEIF